MKLGGLDISTVKLGASQVQAIYQGQNLVWQNAPVATAATGVGQTSFTANWEAYTGAVVYYLDVSESSDFSTFVYENQIVEAPNTSYVVIGLNSNTTYYYRVRASDDADSLGFFQRVNIAGGTLTSTEQIAIIELVQDLKDYGIWTKMKAIYPMVGASAAACAQNLKSSSFTGTFTVTGWTFASTGVTPNGMSAYMDTALSPSANLSLNSTHLSYYSRTNISQPGVDMGAVQAPNKMCYLLYSYNGSSPKAINRAETVSGSIFTPTTNLIIGSRTNSTTEKYYHQGTLINTLSVSSGDLTTNNIYIGAFNNGSASLFTTKECAFASIGDGLTDTEASDFYTAVQAFQTTLNRAII